MTPFETKLRQHLACYGADVSSWPEKAKELGIAALREREFAAIIAQERQFETMLLFRHEARANSDFAERILAAAASRVPSQGRMVGIADMLNCLQPVSLVATLAIGFLIGFNSYMPLPAATATASTQSYPDDDEALL